MQHGWKRVQWGCALVLALLAAGATRAAAQEHLGQYSDADIRHGAVLYTENCNRCHGSAGTSIPNVDLASGKFRNASSDDDLRRIITNGIQGTAMPPGKFEQPEVLALIAYVRNMRDFGTRATKLGDPARGHTIVEGKGACLSCHAINGKGSRLAPDLSEIGSVRAASALQSSLIDPNGSMLPNNRSVRAVKRDGKVIVGRRLNEDSFTVQLIDEQEHLVSLMKSDLREYKVLTTSPMPSYKNKLSPEEMADTLAYLVTLKGK